MASQGTKPIEKKILHGVTGMQFDQSISGQDLYPKETKLKFHFKCELCDVNSTVLDDSRKWIAPMELIIGRKFKFDAWETCLQTMSIGEVSLFTIKKSHTYNYPIVAKALRDQFLPDKNGKAKPQHLKETHSCSMQMMSALEYDDLKQLLKEPADMKFTIELLQAEYPDEYKKDSWQMDPNEKLMSAQGLRLEGNDLYKKNKVLEAAEKYAMAIGLIEQLMLREKPEEEEWIELRNLKIPLLLNFSQCKLNLKEYYPVIEHCDEVLVAEPENVKALFRRAKAHAGAWNPSEAKSDFKRVSEIDSKLRKTCEEEIKNIEKLEAEKTNEDKEKLKNLFKTISIQ